MNNYFPKNGLSALDSYKIIKKQLLHDGDTLFDLGSFTSTDMSLHCEQIYIENLDKNLANVNEYSASLKVETSLVSCIAKLLNVPDTEFIFGKSTAGSSEAIAMAMLIYKYEWLKRSSASLPNIIFCSDAHLCWHRFAKYFSIEAREIPLSDDAVYPFDSIIDNIDENTICVVAVAGSTYTGSCDPIVELNQRLLNVNKKMGYDVGIHIDAAIGGFVLPFLKNQDIYPWDFRCELVRSINLSGHKFGMVYPGLGWLIVRDKTRVDESLSLDSNYLSGHSLSFSLNFSRPAAPVIAQYFNFLHLGVSGYQRIIRQCIRTAIQLSNQLENSGLFVVVSDLKLPVVTFKFIETLNIDEQKFVTELRESGWMLPCYKLTNPSQTMVMRIVVRHTSTTDLYNKLNDDILKTVHRLVNTPQIRANLFS